jgi:hypothetical protein
MVQLRVSCEQRGMDRSPEAAALLICSNQLYVLLCV